MKHSAQIVTWSTQRQAYGSMPLEPAETRPRVNFRELRNAFSKVRSAKLNTDVTILCLAQTILAKQHLNKTSHTCQHYAEITQSHTFAPLIRLSTTTHNLLTFNMSEISWKNSEKLSVLHWQRNTSGLFSHTRLMQVPRC